MNTKEYWQTVSKTLGLPEDKAKSMEELLSDEKVANLFVPRPDFSSELDKKDKALQAYRTEVENYYKSESVKAADRQKLVDDAVSKAQRYQDLYGELPNDGTQRQTVATPAFDGSKYISRDDYEKELKRIEGQSLYVIKEGLKASQDYMSKFGKPLDIDALEKFALERNLPINLAYKEMIQPELEAKQNSTWEEKLKRAREEGAAEARSRANVPIDTQPREVSPFLSNVLSKPQTTGTPAQPLSVSERLSNFAAEYSKQTSTAK